MSAAAKPVKLGAGNFYIDEYEDGAAIPADEVLEVDANHLGYTKGGATVEYTPEVLEEKDDSGITRLLAIISEEAKITTGLLTWDTSIMAKLTQNDMVEVAPAVGTAGKRTLKIGGRGKTGLKKHVIRFVHADGKLRLTIVASNQNGFSLEFLKDSGTVYDAEFTAHTSDDDGTLIIIEEIIPALPAV